MINQKSRNYSRNYPLGGYIINKTEDNTLRNQLTLTSNPNYNPKLKNNMRNKMK